MRRGFNLTGWIDHRVGALPRRPSQELLNKLAGLGFAHVRLPLTAELVMPEFATEDAINSTFAEVDDALMRLFASGFAVSIDVHSGAGFEALHKRDPEAGLRSLASLWRRLARRYAAQDPERLYFELLNEPAINSDLWRAQALSLITTIREFNPNRTIVYGAARFSRYDRLIAEVPLAADNIVYAVHYYDPMPFTHQGANWSGSDPYRFYHDIPFPAAIDDDRIDLLTAELKKQRRDFAVSTLQQSYSEPWTEARIEQEIAKVGEWATRMNVAVIASFVCAPHAHTIVLISQSRADAIRC
jgi:endoglucanase